jgi:hypothetical protein
LSSTCATTTAGSSTSRSVLGQRSLELPTILVTNQHSRPIGESLTGKDSQLDRAVKELLAVVGR